jgi:hypothetical protein
VIVWGATVSRLWTEAEGELIFIGRGGFGNVKLAFRVTPIT